MLDLKWYLSHTYQKWFPHKKRCVFLYHLQLMRKLETPFKYSDKYFMRNMISNKYK